MVSDAKLPTDVRGFIRREAIHARVHSNAEVVFAGSWCQPDPSVAKLNGLFEQFWGSTLWHQSAENRLRKKMVDNTCGSDAAIEHFTGMLRAMVHGQHQLGQR